MISKTDPQNAEKILIIGASWVGDMVMAQTLFIFLKKQFPKSKIDVIAPAWSTGILERMPEVNECIDLPFKHKEFKPLMRRKVGKLLRKNNYDRAYILPNSWKSAFIPFFAKIPIRVGFKGESRYGLLTDLKKLDKQALPLMIDRFLSLGLSKIKKPTTSDIPSYKNKEIYYPNLKSNKKTQYALLKRFKHVKSNKKILSLCPGAAFGPSKQWPAEHHAEVANKMLDNNWEAWLLGAGKDIEIINKINKLTKNRCSIFGNDAALADKIDLLAMSDMVITNDSGLMHIACAVNTPVVAVYGSTSPDFTPPLAPIHKYKILSISPKVLTCRPCFQRTCRFGHYKCKKNISADDAINAIKELSG